MPLRVEPLRPKRDLAVGAERAARAGEMRVGEEVTKAGVRQMLLNAAADLLPPPFAARAIGALGQPAARRSDPEQAPVLLPAHRELESDAFVPAEERQVAVRRRGPHDLETAPILEPTKRSDEISLDSPE